MQNLTPKKTTFLEVMYRTNKDAMPAAGTLELRYLLPRHPVRLHNPKQAEAGKQRRVGEGGTS